MKTNMTFLKKILKKQNIKLAILFGSRAQKNHRQDSDYDIAILQERYDSEELDNIYHNLKNNLK